MTMMNVCEFCKIIERNDNLRILHEEEQRLAKERAKAEGGNRPRFFIEIS